MTSTKGDKAREMKEPVSIAELETWRTTSSGTEASSPVFSGKDQKRIMWHIDRRVVGVLGAMYAVSLIDRLTTGVALITGMGMDLELKGSRYNLINALFFVPYVLFQFPATLLSRKIGPRYFLSAATLLWGLTTLCCGFVRTWTDMLALRMCLGLWEAGFFPSCVYLLSSWYPRYELQKRNAGFFLLGLVPSAFCGIFSYGISHMKGLGVGPDFWGEHSIKMSAAGTPVGISYGGGLAGWRWIFIIFGTVTCVIAVCGFFLVVDFPEQLMSDSQKGCYVKFLTKDEAAWQVDRIEKDRKDVMLTKFDFSEYLSYAGDLKIWGFALMYGLVGLLGYGISFSLPIILINTMGFSVAKAQCMVTPPYLVAAVATWFVAVYSDKWKLRSPFVLVCLFLVIIGICLIGFVENTGAKYFGVFFAALPQCAMVPALLTWQANNIRGQWKRALVSAFSVAMGAAGGLGGSFVFRIQDTPHYYPAFATCLAATSGTIVIVLLLLLKFTRANKRAAAGGKIIEGLEGFRYTL